MIHKKANFTHFVRPHLLEASRKCKLHGASLFHEKKVETAFMTMNDDVTGRISTKTVKVKCTSLLERGNPLVLMFEIIDHKDFATVRLMDGGSRMQFGIKKLVHKYFS